MHKTYANAYSAYRTKFGRESVCNHRDLDLIFDVATYEGTILDLMLAEVGQPSVMRTGLKRYPLS